jgi:hypothetical protein
MGGYNQKCNATDKLIGMADAKLKPTKAAVASSFEAQSLPTNLQVFSIRNQLLMKPSLIQ